jgi:hypothetical protein
MRLVGLRSFLASLPTLALACMATSPSAPEQAPKAATPPSAVEQAAAAAAPGDPSAPIQAEPAKESQPSPTRSRDDSAAAPPPAAPTAPIGGEADRSQSRLDIAVPSINGGLNRDIIRRTASDHADDIRDCHGRALASMPDLTGELTVELWIDDRGRVTNAELAGDDALTTRIGECVMALAIGWTFADAGGEGSFKLAFDFSAIATD